MKKLLLVLSIFLFTSSLFAQDAKDATEESTKMDTFVSKTGTIKKMIDYSLPDLTVRNGLAETKIREVIIGPDNTYFYIISNQEKSAALTYEELIELIKAIEALKKESISDRALNPDYLQNRFITNDGFELGYYINNGKLTWFMRLEDYGSGSIIYIKKVSVIESTFNSAKQKIEELKDQKENYEK